MFGQLYIDPNKLMEMKLEAYKNNKKVISQKFDPYFIDLLTKRYNSKKTYSQKSLELFNKLIMLSGLPINNRSMKFERVVSNNSQNNEIKYYSSPDELISRLQLLI